MRNVGHKRCCVRVITAPLQPNYSATQRQFLSYTKHKQLKTRVKSETASRKKTPQGVGYACLQRIPWFATTVPNSEALAELCTDPLTLRNPLLSLFVFLLRSSRLALLSCDLTYDHGMERQNISDEAKDLVTKLLRKEPHKRLPLEEVSKSCGCTQSGRLAPFFGLAPVRMGWAAAVLLGKRA